jgi:FtsZ-binding cell division protein ZapB
MATARTKTKERRTIDNLNRAKGFGRVARNTDRIESDETNTDTNLEVEETPASNCDGADDDSDEAPTPEVPVTLTRTELETYVKAAVDRVNAASKLEIDSVRKEKDKLAEESKKEADKLTTELADQKAKQDTLNAVFGQFSLNAPSTSDARAPQTQTQTRSREMDGKDAAKEFMRLLDSRSDTPAKTWVNPNTGEQYEQKDTYHADRFAAKNREKLRDGMEAFARKNGLLRGQGSDAATARADIPPAFIDYLSGVVRQNHSPKFIFHQFANGKVEIGKGEGDTIQIPRLPFGQTGTTLADWDITGQGTLVATDQPLTANSVSITLKEYGMGKNATIQPIGIPEFILARSLLDLEAALSQNLGQNYYEFEDIGLRNLWFGTTRVVYNKSNNVETVPVNLTAGSGGTITYAFLNNLYAYMCGLQIPSYQNGKYGLVLNSTALAQLVNDLATRNLYMTKSDMADITNIMNAATKSDMPKMDGYCGDVGNFMIFVTNAISLGAPLTPGVQTETLGIGARTTRTCFAFGASTIARVAGMPMQIRRDNNDDFQRRNRCIWVSHEGFGYLDVDPAINAAQQLRVVQVRHTDLAI